MSKKYHFRGHFGERHGESEQALLKSGCQDLSHSYSSLLKQLGWKKSLLKICKVLKLFVNTLTSRDKYSLRNRGSLTEPIQMWLSQKQESLSQFSFAFLKSKLNLKRFPTKGNHYSWCIFEITEFEERA